MAGSTPIRIKIKNDGFRLAAGLEKIFFRIR
jgi:hypothetical protein